MLAAFSDGITEARDPRDHIFTRERVCAALLRNSHGTAAEISEALIEEVGSFGGDGHQTDDVTLVTVKLSEAAELACSRRSLLETDQWS